MFGGRCQSHDFRKVHEKCTGLCWQTISKYTTGFVLKSPRLLHRGPLVAWGPGLACRVPTWLETAVSLKCHQPYPILSEITTVTGRFSRFLTHTKSSCMLVKKHDHRNNDSKHRHKADGDKREPVDSLHSQLIQWAVSCFLETAARLYKASPAQPR